MSSLEPEDRRGIRTWLSEGRAAASVIGAVAPPAPAAGDIDEAGTGQGSRPARESQRALR